MRVCGLFAVPVGGAKFKAGTVPSLPAFLVFPSVALHYVVRSGPAKFATFRGHQGAKMGAIFGGMGAHKKPGPSQAGASRPARRARSFAFLSSGQFMHHIACVGTPPLPKPAHGKIRLGDRSSFDSPKVFHPPSPCTSMHVARCPAISRRADRRAVWARLWPGRLRGVAANSWGQWGQIVKIHVNPCQHWGNLSPLSVGTNRFAVGTVGTNHSRHVRRRPPLGLVWCLVRLIRCFAARK